MFSEYPFITFLFRIVNFGALFGLGYFLYRRYFKFRIEEKINQKEALVKGLEEQGQALEGRALFLHQQLSSQAKNINELKLKIDDWQAAVKTSQNRLAQERIQCAQKAAQRVEIKNDHLMQAYYKQAVVAEALAQAQKELEHEYADTARNRQFIDEQMKKLRGAA